MKNSEKSRAYKIRVFKVTHFVDILVTDVENEGGAHREAIKAFQRLKPEMEEMPEGMILAVTLTPEMEAAGEGGSRVH